MEPMPPVRYATAQDQARIAYMQWPGESPPFLALYTAGSPPLSYKAKGPGYARWWKRFAMGRSWAMFDWRGTAASSPITGELANDHLEWDIEAVVEAITGPVDVAAVGRACIPLFTLASRRPELFRSLWVVPHGVRYDASLDIRLRPGWEANYREHLRHLWLGFGATPAESERTARIWEEAVPKESLAAYLRAAAQVDLHPVLPRVEIPTWVTVRTGEESGPAAEVAALLPNATLATGERGGVITEFTRDDWEAHLGRRLPGNSAPAPSGQPSVALTDRESEVLLLIATGKRNPDIAEILTISTRTVENHIANIYAKIGVHNRVEAANWTREHGLR